MIGGRRPKPERPRKKERKKRLGGKTKLLLGAGGLLLFIVGLKRSYRLDEGGTVLQDAPEQAGEEGGSPRAGGG